MRAVSWERLADGRLHRLKQGKHFAADPRAFQVEVLAAAARLGKAVRSLRDEMGKHTYLWVQFADHEVALGAPCPCGHTALVREHEFFGRCPSCGATLIFVLPRNAVTTEQRALAEKDAAALADSEFAGPAVLARGPRRRS